MLPAGTLPETMIKWAAKDVPPMYQPIASNQVKTLYLHIGTEKTGTKTLQSFLRRNETLLNKTGHTYYCSPNKKYYADNPAVFQHGHFPVVACFQPQCPEYVTSSQYYGKEELLAELRDDLSRENRNVILSAEHFSSRMRDENEMRELAQTFAGFTVKIVVYLRPQFDMLCSAYSTAVKGGRRERLSMDEANPDDPYYNYHAMLAPWAEVFGSSNIVVRDYRNLAGHDIRTDFLDLLGIEDASTFERGQEDLNIALDAAQAEALRLINQHLPTFQEVGSDLHQHFVAIRACLFPMLPRGPHLHETFDAQSRRTIIERFKPGNDAVARQYMAEGALAKWHDVSGSECGVAPAFTLGIERMAQLAARLAQLNHECEHARLLEQSSERQTGDVIAPKTLS